MAETLRLILFCLSSVYRVAIRIRNQAFDCGLKHAHQVDATVISVGNLTAGGTGKTPFVIWLAGQLERTRAVAVVSRCYGAQYCRLNDEGLEIRQRLPAVTQVQDPDRVAAAQQAISEMSPRQAAANLPLRPVVLLDDGFQHRRLARDLDILLIDSIRPFGFGFLLPRGLLREPIQSVKRANLAVLTRANLVDDSKREAIRKQLLLHHPRLKLAEAELVTEHWLAADQQQYPLERLLGKRLFAFCGIGNPEGFLDTLQHAGMNVVECLEFDDHHRFRPDDIQSVGARAEQSHCDAIVCTHKDLVKLDFQLTGRLPIYALLTTVRISQGEDLVTAVIRDALAKLEDAGRNESAEALPHG